MPARCHSLPAIRQPSLHHIGQRSSRRNVTEVAAPTGYRADDARTQHPLLPVSWIGDGTRKRRCHASSRGMPDTSLVKRVPDADCLLRHPSMPPEHLQQDEPAVATTLQE